MLKQMWEKLDALTISAAACDSPVTHSIALVRAEDVMHVEKARPVTAVPAIHTLASTLGTLYHFGADSAWRCGGRGGRSAKPCCLIHRIGSKRYDVEIKKSLCDFETF